MSKCGNYILLISNSPANSFIWNYINDEIVELEGDYRRFNIATFINNCEHIAIVNGNSIVVLDIATGKIISVQENVPVRGITKIFNISNGHELLVTGREEIFVWKPTTLTEDIDYAINNLPYCFTKEQRKKYYLNEHSPMWCVDRWPYNEEEQVAK